MKMTAEIAEYAENETCNLYQVGQSGRKLLKMFSSGTGGQL